MKLPYWLTRSLKDKNVSALLRIYMKHRLFEEAGYLIVDMLRDVQVIHTGYINVIKKLRLDSKPQSVWLPYGLIDQLLHQIKQFTEGKNPNLILLRLKTDIEEGVNFYLKDVGETTSRLKTDGMIQ